jgi:glycosyltransferase involved in cell wall biosynthesis
VLFRSEEERVVAQQSFWLYRVREAVVDNGIADPGGDPAVQRARFLEAYPELKDRRSLLFLSRIHPKKGCDLLIEAFARVAAEDPALRLLMAGPDQEGWRSKLEALARSRGIADRITWTGMLQGDLKWGAFRVADAFVLPSHQENFGITVVEALACGLPVLITDKVNIWREIAKAEAGFVEADTLSGVTALLQRWLSAPSEAVESMREHARTCFERHFEIRRAARKLVDVIETCLEAGALSTTRAMEE